MMPSISGDTDCQLSACIDADGRHLNIA